MRKIEYIIEEKYNGIKVEAYLRSIKGVSYRLLKKLKKTSDGITINGIHARSIDIISTNDVLAITMPEDALPAESVEMPLEIIYEDEDLLVCNKPHNLAVHPSPGHEKDTLANAVAAYLEKQGHRLAFRPVNRLDRDTSGLVLCAKTPLAAAKTGGNTDKTYFAVCQGCIENSGTIDLPIAVMPGHTIQRYIAPDGIRAVTHYQPIMALHDHTLLRIKLETGRTHQIRVHFSSIGHPLAGDDMYGGSREFIARQALHCGEISFIHPTNDKPMNLSADFPDDFKTLISKLQKH